MLRALKAVTIKKTSEERQIVWGEVYAPDVLDSHGEFMTAQDIKDMAKKFGMQHKIDVMHDNKTINAYPVESFIAKANDPLYTEGAWVLGVKINDKEVWAAVKSGKLNGYSFEAMVKKMPCVVEIEYHPSAFGETEEIFGHTHLYFLEINEDGVVKGGRTSTDYGHSHEIRDGTATVEELGHAHRFFIT